MLMNLNSVPKIDFRPGKAKIRKDTSNTFSLSLSLTHTQWQKLKGVIL